MASEWFFHFDTGEATNHGSPFGCWMADSNLWIVNDSLSISVNHVAVDSFTKFLERASTTKETIDMDDEDGLHIALEDEDEGRRNLFFGHGSLCIIFNIKSEYLPKLAQFIRNNRQE